VRPMVVFGSHSRRTATGTSWPGSLQVGTEAIPLPTTHLAALAIEHGSHALREGATAGNRTLVVSTWINS
jgi:hypothetical protein